MTYQEFINLISQPTEESIAIAIAYNVHDLKRHDAFQYDHLKEVRTDKIEGGIVVTFITEKWDKEYEYTVSDDRLCYFGRGAGYGRNII